MNIYVGNLSYEVTEDALREAFEEFGQVASVTLIKDKYSGQSKGFGFVEMSSKAEGQSAIDGLNGKELKGRVLNVCEARPRTESSRGRGGRGGGRRCYIDFSYTSDVGMVIYQSKNPYLYDTPKP